MEFSNKPSYKIYCKTDPNFSLTVKDGKHWYKDEKYGSTVKDNEGVPSFALVNKPTGQAIEHSTGADHPVQLVSQSPNNVDESVLWTDAKDSESGYKSIRMVTNTSLYIDAHSGHVEDGTYVILWPRNHADNQWWKFEQHSVPSEPTFQVYCKDGPNFVLTIRNGKVVLAPANPKDDFQHWYKDEKNGTKVKDKYGLTSFSLINKATGQAIKHPIASHQTWK